MTDGNGASRVKFALEERTTKFGKAIVQFAKCIPVSTVTIPLISQLVRSGTSVGANYCEADDAESKRDFRHKIAICRKEARETKYWLQMIVAAQPPIAEKARDLWREAIRWLSIRHCSFGIDSSFGLRPSSL